MRMTDLEKRAMALAQEAHRSQMRKYTGLPYITHPANVAQIVSKVPHTEEMLAAAWLHDVVEDCNIPLGLIESGFGVRVADLVGWLTDVSTPADGNRAARKLIDLKHTALAPAEAQTIKLADLIDNTGSIVQHDPDFAKVYLKEKRALLEVLTKGDKALLGTAFATLIDGERSLAS